MLKKLNNDVKSENLDNKAKLKYNSYCNDVRKLKPYDNKVLLGLTNYMISLLNTTNEVD